MNSAAAKAVASEPPEPLGANRGKRRRFDPECFEPRSAAAWDIIALEHQPLVARKRRAGEEAETGQGASNKSGSGSRSGVWPVSSRIA